MSGFVEWLVCKYLKLKGAEYNVDVWTFKDNQLCDFSPVVYYSYWSFSGIRSIIKLDIAFPNRTKSISVNFINLPLILLNLRKAINLIKHKDKDNV